MPKFRFDKSPYSVFLGLLISADLAFIGVDIAYPDCGICSIGRDRGFPEVYQYIKLFWGVILLGALALTRSSLIYASWTLVFLYLFIDDASMLHESYGKYLADALSFRPLFGLRAVDFGELLITGIAGLLLLIPLTIGYFRSKEHERAFSRYLVAIVFALAFFGVFVDMLQITAGNTQLGEVLGMVEEGGEMIVVSVMLWFVFRHGFDRNLAQ